MATVVVVLYAVWVLLTLFAVGAWLAVDRGAPIEDSIFAPTPQAASTGAPAVTADPQG